MSKARLKELKEKHAFYQSELDDLHMVETNEIYYNIRRYEIESQIAMIEDAIDDIKDTERMMRPFRYTFIAFCIASAALLIVAILKL
jgi:hypothetical protein